ncbi:hypothetical protein [Rhodococcoides fascians]|uniref:hypothetical protein n=1 Tax=Rhodococcoides fascians TaxID=1828 RepID=UPI00056586CD|nr:hypothetical protein [Rhodococcus fascians]
MSRILPQHDLLIIRNENAVAVTARAAFIRIRFRCHIRVHDLMQLKVGGGVASADDTGHDAAVCDSFPFLAFAGSDGEGFGGAFEEAGAGVSALCLCETGFRFVVPKLIFSWLEE